MKLVENKSTNILKSESKPDKLSYKDLIASCINQAVSTGYSIVEMRQRIKILDTLDNMKKNVISIEDADYDFLKKAVSETKWLMLHKDIIAFSDYIESL